MRFPIRLSVSSVPRKSSEIKADCRTPPTAADAPIPISRYGWFALIAVVGCTVDLVTKQWIFEWGGDAHLGTVWWIWDGYIGIQTAENTGALFGLGQDQGALFAVISVAAILGILYWLFRAGAAHDVQLTIALGCVFGGILGNLYDRLGFWGRAAVRDWILLRYGHFTWPNFNIADSLLVCGAALLIWHGFRSSKSKLSALTGD